MWEVGVNTYDASMNRNFNMRAALLWTISDFPALANLSGWSTKGEFACPSCHKDTCSRWLRYSGKHCYMGHCRFLASDHPFRKNKRSFNGFEEHDKAPSQLSGDMVLRELDGHTHTFGRLNNDNRNLPYNWKKRSIFFELPYWKGNILRHNLDVMHIESNVCESVLATILGLDKSKDHAKTRDDLQEMGIRPELHPIVDESGKRYYPPPCFLMNRAEKEIFCGVLKQIKVPDGYSSNISKCISKKPPKIFGLKSHENHILMQQLFPLALRRVLPKQVRAPLIDLCNFFRGLCSKVLHARELIQLERRIALTLCHLERIFPPSFFDIMVHLPIHLATEARLAGPVQYRWMYPVERYLSTLKAYVRNRSHPEGSIAEGYLAEECVVFCARYLDDVETRSNRATRNHDGNIDTRVELPIFVNPGRHLRGVNIVNWDVDTMKRAHQYVLFNCEIVQPFLR